MDSSFPPSARLRIPAEFERVFKAGRRQSDACFTVLYLTNHIGYARLGLVVPKRQIADAHARNRVKRITRESFRLARASLPANDFVVMVRGMAANRDNAALFALLDHQWQRQCP